MATMALGGLWHGAAWTFVAWGCLHGLYLSINHLWRALCASSSSLARMNALPGMRIAWWMLTFVAVNVAWCLFRAPSFPAAISVIGAMFGAAGAQSSLGWADAAFVAAGLAVVTLLPNSQELVERVRRQGALAAASGLGAAAALLASLYFMMVRQHENFIYFMF
jgi:D-alanyl-lipoteichoic acid acyltransferase DltB (MBOAT superfamily)